MAPTIDPDPPDEAKVAAGAWLRELRLAAGLSLRDLDRATGIDYQQISKYERGFTDPGLTKVLPILEAVGALIRRPGGEGWEAVVSGDAAPVNVEVARLRDVIGRNALLLETLFAAIRVIAPAGKQDQLDPLVENVRRAVDAGVAAIDESAARREAAELREHRG